MAAGQATAQSAAPAEPSPGFAAPHAMVPDFTVIDRIDGRSSVGFEASYLSVHLPDGFTGDKPTVLRFAAHFRYVDPASGVGGYARLPFVYAGASNGGDSITDVGGLELGGIYVPKLALTGVAIILHAGLSLPTGEPRDEFLIGTAANAAALPAFYGALPRALTGTLGVSAVLRSDRFFMRLDLGVDDNFRNNADGEGDGNFSFPRAYHFNAGVGFDLGTAALTFESENLALGSQDNNDGATLSDLAVGARFAAGTASPYVALVVPIEDTTSEIIDFAVTAGVDLAF